MLLWHKEKGKMAYPLQSFELKLINTKKVIFSLFIEFSVGSK